MAIQKKISRENLRAKKGSVVTALMEGPSKDNPLVWEARLEGMAPEIDGKIYLTDIELPGLLPNRVAVMGDVVRVEITKTDDYDVIGRVVEIGARREFAQEPDGVANAIARRTTAPPPVEQLTRISTGAALRVLA